MIGFLLAATITLVPGSTSMWTDGVHTWAGPAQCLEAGFLLKPDSPAIDAGEWIAGLHCPAAGPDPSGCVEWAQNAPDIGACEYVPTAKGPNAVSNLIVQ